MYTAIKPISLKKELIQCNSDDDYEMRCFPLPKPLNSIKTTNFEFNNTLTLKNSISIFHYY